MSEFHPANAPETRQGNGKNPLLGIQQGSGQNESSIGPGRIKRRQGRYRKITEIDRRTRAGRRASALMAEFEEALGGGITPGQRLAIQRAAILTALAEDKRVRSLAGEPINLDDLVRVDRLAMQAVSQLGISIVRQPKQETLADYVRARAVGAAP